MVPLDPDDLIVPASGSSSCPLATSDLSRAPDSGLDD